MILFIDNYDSFTYNLVQMIGEMDSDIKVLRNDTFTLHDLDILRPRAIIISPGPGTPQQAGLSVQVVRHFAGRIPVLGVCLGHQAIGTCFGAEVVPAPQPVHGKPAQIYHNQDRLFRGLPSPFPAGRYHSLLLRRETLPGCLQVTAQTADGLVMAVRHSKYAVYGVQFHPESVITPEGRQILINFLAGGFAA